ncbi:MAG: LD-carboxypeptidase [Candidatus Electrothrix sp. AR4]|nr:LD-carboxypeptidase [Candidatus Electrothrix sp. AR4]
MPHRQPVLPSPLRPGDTIGVVYPAGPVRNAATLEQGLRILRDLGLRVRHYRPENGDAEYLAADDRHRLLELHRFWADDEVKALIATRGGYGCLRIMKDLDLKLLRSKPKWLIGFSDLTVLLNGISAETGLVTLHGPMVTSLPRADKHSFQHFKEILGGRFHPIPPPADLEILRPGIGQGRLTGGNLTTLTHLIGTPWQPRFADSILFIEDTAESVYKLDRMLTHLFCCGLLDNLAGLILGVFDPGHDDRLEILRLNEQIWKRVLELTASLQYPVWGGFPVGHQRENLSLPIGMEAMMNSITGTLNFLPNTCRRP